MTCGETTMRLLDETHRNLETSLWIGECASEVIGYKSLLTDQQYLSSAICTHSLANVISCSLDLLAGIINLICMLTVPWSDHLGDLTYSFLSIELIHL